MPKLFLVPLALMVLAGPVLAAPGDTPPAPTAPPSAGDRPARTGTGIMRYDSNKDGVVDKAEWNAGQEARFKRLDANNDGKLSQEELFARTPAIGNSVLPTDRQAQPGVRQVVALGVHRHRPTGGLEAFGVDGAELAVVRQTVARAEEKAGRWTLGRRHREF